MTYVILNCSTIGLPFYCRMTPKVFLIVVSKPLSLSHNLKLKDIFYPNHTRHHTLEFKILVQNSLRQFVVNFKIPKIPIKCT